MQFDIYVLMLVAVSFTWGFPHAKDCGKHLFCPVREMHLWSPFIGDWHKARDVWFMCFLNRFPSSPKKPYHLDTVLSEGTAIPFLCFWNLRNNGLVGRGRPWVTDIINQTQGLGAFSEKVLDLSKGQQGCQVHGDWPGKRVKMKDRREDRLGWGEGIRWW